MKKIRYTTRKKFEPNCCHSPMCELSQRKECEKEKACQIQLCGDDERQIAGFSIYKVIGEYELEHLQQKVEEWRKQEFKKCKKVCLSIEFV